MARSLAERWQVVDGASVCVDLFEANTKAMIVEALQAVLEENVCETTD